MGYADDPQARSALSAAFTGLGAALVFLLLVGGITFFWAKNATPHHAPAGEHAPAAASQH
ncbi:MAG TPA: hypothetical protein VM759_06450 [Longimicrobium sp.]|nr:hypothetical protein [Longimicrobium sp.]